MTGFVKTKGNKFVEYPYGAAELQRDNPEANYDYFCDFASIFPATPAATRDGFALSPVVIDADPVYDGQTQTVHRSELPFIRDGGWVFSWIVTDLTPEQIANMQAMREEPRAV
jgi:hypothetical protein